MQTTAQSLEQQKQRDRAKHLANIYGCDEEKAAFLENYAVETVTLIECGKPPQLTKEEIENALWEYINRATNLQREIAKVTERAEQDIKPAAYSLNHLESKWKPFVAHYAPELMTNENQRTLKIGSAGVIRFEDTGGHYIDDKDKSEVEEWLRKQSDADLAEFGAFRKIAWDKRKLLAYVRNTGAVVPGVSFVEVNRTGKHRTGDTSPFSPVSLMKRVKKAFTVLTAVDTDSEEGEE